MKRSSANSVEQLWQPIQRSNSVNVNNSPILPAIVVKSVDSWESCSLPKRASSNKSSKHIYPPPILRRVSSRIDTSLNGSPSSNKSITTLSSRGNSVRSNRVVPSNVDTTLASHGSSARRDGDTHSGGSVNNISTNDNMSNKSNKSTVSSHGSSVRRDGDSTTHSGGSINNISTNDNISIKSTVSSHGSSVRSAGDVESNTHSGGSYNNISTNDNISIKSIPSSHGSSMRRTGDNTIYLEGSINNISSNDNKSIKSNLSSHGSSARMDGDSTHSRSNVDNISNKSIKSTVSSHGSSVRSKSIKSTVSSHGSSVRMDGDTHSRGSVNNISYNDNMSDKSIKSTLSSHGSSVSTNGDNTILSGGVISPNASTVSSRCNTSSGGDTNCHKMRRHMSIVSCGSSVLSGVEKEMFIPYYRPSVKSMPNWGDIPSTQLESEEYLTCCECHLGFDTLNRQPLRLFCHHNMCQHCVLTQLKSTFWDIKCSLCPIKTTLPTAFRLQYLRLNTQVLDLSVQ